MTAKEMYDDMISEVSVKCDREDILIEKYGKSYEELLATFEQFDYANTILAKPILSSMSADERKVFDSTLIKIVPIDAINACAKKADNNEYLVVLNERLLALIHSYHEIQFVSALETINGAEVQCFAKYFAPLIDCYLMPNSDKTLPIYSKAIISEEMKLLIIHLTIANEQFVLAHELAHIYLNHFNQIYSPESFSIENFLYGANTMQQEKEFAADIQAVKWLHNMIDNNNNHINLAMYIEVFVLFHLIECNLGFPGKNASHPPALERLKNIRNNCASCFTDEDIKFIDEMIENCNDTDSFRMH